MRQSKLTKTKKIISSKYFGNCLDTLIINDMKIVEEGLSGIKKYSTIYGK